MARSERDGAPEPRPEQSPGGARERIRRELRGLFVLYLVMAVFSAAVALLCVGSAPP